MNHGTIILMYAAERGHIKTVRTLLKLGADANAVNYDGITGLMLGII